MATALLFTHALSPLHPGVGQGSDVIDLPVARERATGLPYLPGSSLKGALRGLGEENDMTFAVFGPPTSSTHEQHSGALVVGDQRLLLLPIRSLAGTFAYVTSPYVLRRFARDAADAGLKDVPASVPVPAGRNQCLVGETSVLRLKERVYLEDLDLHAETAPAADGWAAWLAAHIFADTPAYQQQLIERFCIVHDDVFSFLLETATEVTARIRVDEQSHTVAKGALWYEEALPAETVLAGPVITHKSRRKGVSLDSAGVLAVVRELITRPMQLGGKATVGRGVCRVQLAGGHHDN